MVKVSVYMPAYNMERYIAAAIESILDQTFTDFELIIINDGSTDNTAKIVREYARRDPRIRFIDNRKNRGFIAASNCGLDAARGEYIAKMDSDDISHPDRLAKQVAFLDQNPDIGMVGCALQAFGDGDFVVRHRPRAGMLDALIEIPTTVFMARADIIRNNNLRFNPDFFACEDYEFYFQFLKHAPIANLQEILYQYRWHGNNASIKSNDLQRKNARRVRAAIIDYLAGDMAIADTLRAMVETQQKMVPDVRIFATSPHKTPKENQDRILPVWVFARLACPGWRGVLV